MRGVSLPQFGGLNLQDDPQEVGWGGAIDMLNVDLDRRGRVRSRDGFAKYTTSTAATAYTSIVAVPNTSVLLASRSGPNTDYINPSGVVTATSGALGGAVVDAANLGTPTSSYTYLATGSTVTVKRLSGSTFSAPTATVDGVAGRAMPFGQVIGVTPWDGRLVVGQTSASGGPNGAASSASHLWFSGDIAAGVQTIDGEHWNTSQYVQLTPGDGESIVKIVAWRELLFVFKQTKFFVFYGTSTSSTGTPIFNYRTVNMGLGLLGNNGPAIATPNGVYFVHDSGLSTGGLYLTTGGPPTRVSRSVDTLFGEAAVPSYYSGPIADGSSTLGWYRSRLYIASLNQSSVLVFDPATGGWMVWSVTFLAFSDNNQQGLWFSTADTYIKRFSASQTSDDGTAITSRYRTGFNDFGNPDRETAISELILDGYGTVAVSKAVNDSSTLGTAANVTLGTSPAIAQGRDRRGFRGRNVSLNFASVSGGAWGLSRVTANVLNPESAGVKASA